MKTETIQTLSGKEIQFNGGLPNKDTMNYWVDLDVRNRDHYHIFASLFTDNDAYPLFRIKPEPKTVMVRIALMQNDGVFYTEVVNDYREAGDLEEKEIEKNTGYFVKWLTDWVIYKFIP